MKVDAHTKDLLDALDKDDIINYLYDEKILSHQVVKKYFKIDDIDFRPNISYWTRVRIEDLGIDEEDILETMSDDEICNYLKDNNYIFPNDCIFEANVDTFFEEDENPIECEDNVFVNYIENLIHKKYGRTFSYKELKDKICELIDNYGYNHK